jgi:hypothetical protein
MLVKWIAAAFAFAAAFGAAAQTVTITYRETAAFGYDETTIITCQGSPTCSGSYSTTVRAENCPNV